MTRQRDGHAAIVIGTVVLVTTLAACGGGSSSGSTPGSGTHATRPKPDGNDPSRYVGLKQDDAIARANADGRPWRIARVDGESFPLTQDFVENRVNFEIEHGHVVRATFG